MSVFSLLSMVVDGGEKRSGDDDGVFGIHQRETHGRGREDEEKGGISLGM